MSRNLEVTPTIKRIERVASPKQDGFARDGDMGISALFMNLLALFGFLKMYITLIIIIKKKKKKKKKMHAGVPVVAQ